MPPRGGSQDLYANILYDSVTESAANTLTFEAVDIGLNIFDKVGLKISRIEYHGWQSQLAAGTDRAEFGLSASNNWTTPDVAESSMIDYSRMTVQAIGTPATAVIFQEPWIKDWSNLPQGGLLIAPKPLYLWAKGTALAAAMTIKARIFFTVIAMKPEEYFELLESRQYFG